MTDAHMNPPVAPAGFIGVRVCHRVSSYAPVAACWARARSVAAAAL
ncbi:MAG: hypothetical protein QOF83_2789 [Solirubrobacteraceae bacterium]|jgi:hypothetical protein|nr:hypothetical protein [Solirubrobacteraceae bacterium]